MTKKLIFEGGKVNLSKEMQFCYTKDETIYAKYLRDEQLTVDESEWLIQCEKDIQGNCGIIALVLIGCFAVGALLAVAIWKWSERHEREEY